MACFIVPAAEAVITTIANKAIKKKESENVKVALDVVNESEEKKVPFSRKLSWLSNLLWGGSALLLFEHIWHGEITPWFPFLTAANTPAETMQMLHEMSTVGVAMAVAISAVWILMVAIASKAEKKETKAEILGE